MADQSPRPFRFGVQARRSTDAAGWIELAQRCERLGYSTLTMPDHFDDQFGPFVGLTAAAMATTTLRIGTVVLDNDYRHPVVTAKELATLDLLSGGRLEIGLGAGWMRSDYEQAGLEYDSPGVRIERFVEGMEVIKRCLAGTAFSYAGEHYRIHDFTGTPLPAQPGGPRWLIGGGGPRMLRLAAEHADIVGINASLHSGAIDAESIATMTAAAVDAKVGIVRQAAGERVERIEWSVRAFMVNVNDDRDAARQAIAGMIGFEPAMIAESPFALIGSPAQLVDDLVERRRRWGFSYIVVGADDVDALAPVVAELAGR